MPITITIDQDPNDPSVIEAVIEPPEQDTRQDQYLMQVAIMVISELRHQLQHDPETCPQCQSELIEAAQPGKTH